MSDVQTSSLAGIDHVALTRDRTGLNSDALEALRHSILTYGLRPPVQVSPFLPASHAPTKRGCMTCSAIQAAKSPTMMAPMKTHGVPACHPVACSPRPSERSRRG